MQRALLKELRKSLRKPSSLFNILSYNTCSDTYYGENNDISSWDHISILRRGGVCDMVALHDTSKMFGSGSKPDGYHLVHLVRLFVDLGLVSYCLQLHGYILKFGFSSDAHVSNALMRIYRVTESTEDVHKVFVGITQPTVVSWNSLISGYVHSGHWRKGLSLFLQLDNSNVCADAYSFTLALSASGQLGMLEFGRSLHCKIMKYGLDSGLFVSNCLIDMYGKCCSVEDAICVFDEMIDKDIVSWNSAIAASARNRRLELAYNFFHQMPEPDTISYNELINGIAQFGNIEDAVGILENMPNPNSSSWNSIITGYVNRNQARKALEFFTVMHSNDVRTDGYTYSVLLSGIASVAAPRWGMLIHCCTTKRGLDTSVVVGSALIDMYSKCGQVRNAESIFISLPKKNLVSWNAMISGYAHNGDSYQVIQLFEGLKKDKDLKPDWITFLSVIAACSNNEFPLQKTIQYLDTMINDYGIEPTVEHCCSIIRIMGQRRKVLSAMRMIYDLNFAWSGVVWRALLGACAVCRDLKVASVAAAKVIQLEGDDDYVYVMLSNIFASYGKWEEVNKVRKLMLTRGVIKEVACSWIEVEKPILLPYK